MSVTDIYKQLERDEGNIPYAYKDSKGYLTIGVGFLIDKDKGGRLPKEVSDFWLSYLVREKRKKLIARIPWFTNLDDARQGVLINMAFNLGVGGLLGFKNTLRLVEAGNYEAASKEMLDSKWAREVKGRATRLSDQMKLGSWQ